MKDADGHARVANRGLHERNKWNEAVLFTKLFHKSWVRPEADQARVKERAGSLVVLLLFAFLLL